MVPSDNAYAQVIDVIGLGGTGSWLVRALTPYLDSPTGPEGPPRFVGKLVLVDGDDYESANRGRQHFPKIGNKAAVLAEAVNHTTTHFTTRGLAVYLGREVSEGPHRSTPIRDVVGEGHTVFVCVDNHATRKLVFEHAATLRNVVVLSAGNDYDDGNVMLYVRKEGKDLCPNPLSYQEDIRDAAGKLPGQMSCEELAANGTPQLIAANLWAATLLLSAYHAYTSGKLDTKSPIVYFDVNKLTAAPRQRS